MKNLSRKFRCFSTILLLAVLAIFGVSTPPAHAQDDAEAGFKPLFDGQTLDGWEKAGGGATYTVEAGCIVGRVGPGSNTFLCAKKTYGDFILRLDLKLDVPGNSGIQFRSHIRENGPVFGYQCEVDPSDRAWSGGVYDESRRGWLFPLAGHEEAQKAFRKDDWNQYEIQCVGPWIRTWINGVPCADFVDTADLDGLIALQVHSGQSGQIRWKNIRIKDLGTSQWQPLFNGADLQGWRAIGGGEWTVENGEIHGVSKKDETRHGHLMSEKPYTDFAVRLQFQSTQGNSGFYFRVEEGGWAGVQGFQAEIDPQNDIGGLYETDGRAWVVQPTPEQVKTYFKPGEWNEMIVVAVGKDVIVSVNGTVTARLKNDPGRTAGFLAPQLHGGMDMDVRFRNIELIDLAGEKE